MRWGYYICFSLLLTSCTEEPESIRSQLFENPSSTVSGIDFSNTLTETDSLNILDYLYFYNGGGTAVGDINNDGLPDIYLSGNQVKNRLYLNQGDLKFKDITTTAGVEGKSSWNTGTIMFDANADGFLDIYVRAVVGINNFKGHDELFINNGDNTFTERAAQYGLAFQNYGTTAAVIDFDQDGDLDIYLLNHAVHTEESFGNANLRLKRNEKTGDKLLRNDGNYFTDVSEETGIFGGINSYGLGISVADFNQDGWPDIYVGNDFHEDDYYYINEEGVRFRESLRENFGHTSRFSMGNDAVDINRDGFTDLLSVDMAPESENVLKSSEGDDDLQTQKLRIERFGYHYQFTRNMLFINQPGYQFSEQALMNGISATDWSWSALFADFDNDSYQDLFISNGIPKRPNNLDYINFISSREIQNKLNETRLIDQKALAMMPSGSISNYIYQGTKDYGFKNRSDEWINSRPSVSGATAIADLDNDGDLDLVVNNINEEARIYVNRSKKKNHWLKIKFDYNKSNQIGIGTKVFAYTNKSLQYKELYTARGFQSSSEPIVHFGLGKFQTIDSLKVIWPDNTYQILTNIQSNQTLLIRPTDAQKFIYVSPLREPKLFTKIDDNLGIDFTHKEDPYLDFNRQKLIPFKISDRGPATAVGDLNGDGLDDIYFGSSKFMSSAIYLQKKTDTSTTISASFEKAYQEQLEDNAKTEDVCAIILPYDNEPSLLIGTGGGDFSVMNDALIDYSFNVNDRKKQLPSSGNTSTIIESDYDNDGDLDLFIGNHAVTGDYGTSPTSYLLKNNKGTYTIDKSNPIGSIGMVTDAVWSDFNGDGADDLIVVGEWMSTHFYANKKGVFKRVKVQPERLKGLWQAIEPFDIDDDGDIDYLLGNWGTNSKFTASEDKPLRMYHADFDKNGQTETIVATSKKGKYYPIQGLKELSSQLVTLKKKYSDNASFAGQTVSEIFGKYALENAHLLEVHTLKSGYLKNQNGVFTFVPLGSRMQVAPIMDFVTTDFDGNGKNEVLAGGNYFGVKPYHGRLDSFSGALIKNDSTITEGYKFGLDFAQKSVRQLNILNLAEKRYLLVTFNNDAAQFYEIKNP